MLGDQPGLALVAMAVLVDVAAAAASPTWAAAALVDILAMAELALASHVSLLPQVVAALVAVVVVVLAPQAAVELGFMALDQVEPLAAATLAAAVAQAVRRVEMMDTEQVISLDAVALTVAAAQGRVRAAVAAHCDTSTTFLSRPVKH